MRAGNPGHAPRDSEISYLTADDATSRRITMFLLILGTLFLLDIVTTEVILWMGGIELNPLMTGIVANPALHTVVKMTILLVVFIVSLVAERQVRGSGAMVCCVIITLYIFVVVNNLFVILPGIPV
jgi:hypothetical protein